MTVLGNEKFCLQVDLKDVSRLSSVTGRHLSSLFIHALKHLNPETAPAFVVCCEPKSPMNLSNLVLFPKSLDAKKVGMI